MLLLADEHTELDEALLGSIAGKVKAEKLTEGDLRDCLRLFCMVCNRVQELHFELEDFTGSFLFRVGSKLSAAIFKHGSCAVYSGDLDSPDITMDLELQTMLDLVTGKLGSGAAHMNGDIKYKGTKNGAVKLQAVFELFLDELNAWPIANHPASED